jgi:selenocysteine-specific elongation factor
MPQTREHLAIVELLGIPELRVVISKCDRVESARVQQVQRQMSDLLAPGPYADALQFEVSSHTGKGIDALRQALLTAQNDVRERSDHGGFRLDIDRAFSVSGAGIVVTGTALAGEVTVGDTLLLGQSGKSVRVRGLHAQSQTAAQARIGQRVALNLSADKLALEHIHRGDWLLPEWLFAPSQRVDIDLQLLSSETRAFEHFSPVHVHIGTQDVTARVALLEGGSLAPGGRMLAQLLLNAPVHAVHGDRLVVRDQSAQRTLGGGRVLDPFAPSRQRRGAERLATLNILADAPNLETALPALIAHSESGLDPQRLERQFNRLRATWRLPSDIRIILTRQGQLLFSEARWEALQCALLEHLARFHELEPDQLGPDRDRLRRFAAMPLERPAFIALIDALLAAGTIASSGPWLHLPDHQVKLTDEDEQFWQQLLPRMQQARFDPPWVRDLATATGRTEADSRLLLRKLARIGQVHQVVRDLFYLESTIREMVVMLLQLSAADPVIQAAAFRDRLGIGRKRSIQILEYFDRIGVTRRMGDQRQVRGDNALAQASKADAQG